MQLKLKTNKPKTKKAKPPTKPKAPKKVKIDIHDRAFLDSVPSSDWKSIVFIPKRFYGHFYAQRGTYRFQYILASDVNKVYKKLPWIHGKIDMIEKLNLREIEIR